jgi:hypothetical protein
MNGREMSFVQRQPDRIHESRDLFFFLFATARAHQQSRSFLSDEDDKMFEKSARFESAGWGRGRRDSRGSAKALS